MSKVLLAMNNPVASVFKVIFEKTILSYNYFQFIQEMEIKVFNKLASKQNE